MGGGVDDRRPPKPWVATAGRGVEFGRVRVAAVGRWWRRRPEVMVRGLGGRGGACSPPGLEEARGDNPVGGGWGGGGGGATRPAADEGGWAREDLGRRREVAALAGYGVGGRCRRKEPRV